MAANAAKQIRERLREVKDPEIGRSIADLNMIRSVEVSEGRATIQIALTVTGCPLSTRIRGEIEQKAKEVEGIREVEVHFTTMSDEERSQLNQQLRQGHATQADPFPKTKVVAVGSGKGGVGKSTVTVNLAFALKSLGYSVGVLDADVYGFSIPHLMGLTGVKPTVVGEMIMPPERDGVRMISAGALYGEDQPLVWRGPIISRMIQQFMTDVYWADPDLLLIDLPPGTGDAALTVMQTLPKGNLLMVTTPQSSAAHVAGRIGHMAEMVHFRLVGLVENMSYFVCDKCGERHYIFGQGESEKLARQLEIPVLGELPLQTEVRVCSDQGIPAVLVDDTLRQSYERIAERLTAQLGMRQHVVS